VHRLFDAGYLTVTPEYRVEASNSMRQDFNDGENYLKLHEHARYGAGAGGSAAGR
jgi:putative restriction endonuclease